MPASRSFFRWCEIGRLGEVEERNELAHADLAGVRSQDVDQLHAHGVAECLGHGGQPLGVGALDLRVHNRLAAGRAVGALPLRRQLQIDGHLFIDIN